MKDQLSDRTVIVVIFATIILIFTLVFSLRPHHQLQPDIEWRENQTQGPEMIQL